MKIKKYNISFKLMLSAVVLGSSLLVTTTAFGENKAERDEENLLIELEDGAPEFDYFEKIDQIRHYVDENVDPSQYASLHLDYEENEAGTIVLSFTVEPTDEVKADIEAMVEDEQGDVAFRVVPFTEKELLEKQREIDKAVFEDKVLEEKGFSVYHTSPDIINSRVEVGISPFNEEAIAIVHEHFGAEMVEAVEGQEPHLFIGDGEESSDEVTTMIGDAEVASEEEEVDIQITSVDAEEDNSDAGVFTRVWNWFVGLFS